MQTLCMTQNSDTWLSRCPRAAASAFPIPLVHDRSQRLHDRSQRLISFHWVTYRKAPNKKACLRLAVAHLSGPVPDENSTSYKKAEKTETTFEFDAPASGRQKTSQAAQPLVKVGGLCFYNNTNTRYRYRPP